MPLDELMTHISVMNFGKQNTHRVMNDCVEIITTIKQDAGL